MFNGADVRRTTGDRLVWLITVVAVVVFWLVSTSFRPWDLFDRAGFSSDFYDEQARVFLRGRLAVDPDVAGIEGFVVNDRTYFYYGPFLAIVRLPFALFGDLFVGRLVRISMLVALVVTCRWTARLARAGRRVVRPGPRPTTDNSISESPWPIAVLVAAVAFSPALFAAGWISVYNETEIWALALAIVTMTLTVEWAANGFSDRRTVTLASVAALATTLTRAPIGLGVALAIGVCGIVLLIRRRRRQPESPAIIATALAGGLVPIVTHALVNFTKFGTWLSVPGDQQVLTQLDQRRAAFFEQTGGSFFSPSFLPTTLVQYLRPDAIRFERLVPGIRFGPLAEDRGAIAVETVSPASSLPSSALLLSILAIAGLVWIVRRRPLTWALVVVATTFGALPTLMIGFVANRYLIDMLPPLVAAAALGVWTLGGSASSSRARTSEAESPRVFSQDARAVAALVLAVFGLWTNASLAIWNLELKSPGFSEFRYAVDRVIFGGDSPAIVEIGDEVDPDEPAPRDGVVGVLADCSAIYIAEQRHWVALDRAEGRFAASGTFDADTPSLLTATPTWSLRSSSSSRQPDGTIQVTIDFERDEGRVGFTREIAVADGRVTYEVIADPITGMFFAEVGEDGFFLPPDLGVGDEVDIRPDGAGDIEPSALCLDLTSGREANVGSVHLALT